MMFLQNRLWKGCPRRAQRCPDYKPFGGVPPHFRWRRLGECTTKTPRKPARFRGGYTHGRGKYLGPFRAAPLRFLSSLRGKTLLIIIVTMLGLVGGLYTISRAVLLRGFANLEVDF